MLEVKEISVRFIGDDNPTYVKVLELAVELSDGKVFRQDIMADNRLIDNGADALLRLVAKSFERIANEIKERCGI